MVNYLISSGVRAGTIVIPIYRCEKGTERASHLPKAFCKWQSLGMNRSRVTLLGRVLWEEVMLERSCGGWVVRAGENIAKG